MRRFIPVGVTSALFTVAVVGPGWAQSPVPLPAFETLFTCPSAAHECSPYGQAILGADGAFYGTYPGSDGGVVFRVTTTGVHEVVHRFTEVPGGGNGPIGGLVLASDGDYYGVTVLSWPSTPGGGYGPPTIFRMDASGNVTQLHTFDASGIEGLGLHQAGAGLVEGADGFLYGTTNAGGLWGYGTLYRVRGNGDFEVLHHFDAVTGTGGYSRLTVAHDGAIYGTTYLPNAIFRYTPASGFESVHFFTSIGDSAYDSPIVEGANGWFYGSLSSGGVNAAGIIYRFRALMFGGWTYEVVYEFGRWAVGEFGGYPTALTRAADGNFYLMTSTAGDLFPDGYYYHAQLVVMDGNGNLKVLHRLPREESAAATVLLQAMDGYLYGMAGSLFRFTVSAASASTTLSVAPAVGVAGTQLTLSATLQSGGLPLADKRVNFAWNWYGVFTGYVDVPIGSAVTGPDGVATLPDVIPFFGAATAPNLLHAHYDGEPAFLAVRGSADLDYRRIVPTITWTPPARMAVGTPLGDAHLNATASAPGYFTYTPPAGTILPLGAGQTLRVDYSPVDYTTYDLTSATVTIDVVNDAPPVAVDGSLTTYQNTPATGTLAATDPDGDALTFSIVSNGSNGIATVTNAATGAFTYTPAAGATGSDSFTFKVSDELLESNTATVTVTITPVANPTVDLSPWKNPAGPNMGAEPDITFSGPLIDGVPVRVIAEVFNRGNTAVTNPFVAFLTTSAGNVANIPNRFQQISAGIAAGGSISVTFDWTPNLTDGVTDLRFLVDAFEELSETVENNNDTLQPVTIGSATPMIPTATGGVTTTSAGTAVSGTLAGASPTGVLLTFAVGTQASKGTVTITDAATGAFTYTPNADTYGYETFTFTATDANGTSAPATQMVFIVANALPAPGPIERVSVSSNGTQGDEASYQAVLSADGRFVAMSSSASTLVPGKTNHLSDVFVRDRQTGVTSRVSIASDGTPGNLESANPSISADGRYVAFESASATLVPNDHTQGYDVFVHDRVSGETRRVSVASDGTPGDSDSWGPSLSADGRYVAFTSHASTLVPGDTDGWNDVFVHDRFTGVTRRVSVASDGTQGSGTSEWPSLSADGRYVAFVSLASTLVAGCTGGSWRLFVHDQQTGETQCASVASDGTPAFGTEERPSLSADGRYIAFSSPASLLTAGDSNGVTDIFVHDRVTGETQRVSLASDGNQGDGPSLQPSLTADGRFVVFRSFATNLVAGDTNGQSDVFVHDRLTGETRLASVRDDGTQANDGSDYSAVSADGRYIVFASTADNLVATDTNLMEDVFVVSPATPRREPVASDRVLATEEDTAASGALNAIDPAGGSLTYTLLTTGTIGTATLTDATTGAYRYTPAANANGTDMFTFKASNGAADSNVATVTVTIEAVNDAPVAYDAALTLDPNTAASGTLAGNDVDSTSLTFSIVGNPMKGTVTLLDAAAGTYDYTPTSNVGGADSFTFKVRDEDADSNIATVAITINSPSLAATVLSPNGGETLLANVPTTIRWIASGADSIDVLLSRDGGGTYTIVTGCVALPGTATSCSWTPTGPGTTNALIRVVARAGSATAADVSDAAFTISAHVVGSPVDLGTLGGTTSYAVAINGSGLVVGSSQTTGDAANHAFVWTETSGMVDLGTLGGAYSSADAVNESGVVVGTSQTAVDTEWHAFVWTPMGGMVDLGTLGGTQSGALAVNSDGMVVGSSAIAGDTETHGFVWTEAGGMVDLGTLGGANSYARAVNDDGMVVGEGDPGDATVRHAFVWTETGGMVDLGTLGGANSYVDTVNDSGLVVGGSDLAGDPTPRHAFAWTAAGGMVDIGTLGGTLSYPKALNNAGMVVGESSLTGDLSRDDVERHAFTWSAAEGLVDIGSIGTIGEVWDVNDGGLVVGDDGRPFAMTANLGLVYLGEGGIASAVNNSGTVVGISQIPGSATFHAALWHTDLTTTVALGGTLVTTEDVPASGTLNVSNPQGASLIYMLLTTGTLGTATLTNPATGAFVYEPGPDANGSDTFTFKVNNGVADSNVATITVTITPVNDAPVAYDGTLTLDANTRASGTLAGADVDRTSLTFSIVANPANGTVTLLDAAVGSYNYTPAPNVSGIDSFTFKVGDGEAGSNVATIAITVNPPPLAVTVVSPNGGEKAFANVPTTIRWTASGAGSIDVLLSKNGGGTYTNVTGCMGLAGTATSCSWTPAGPGTTNALIRVIARAGSATAADVSDAAFTVNTATPSITITAPNTVVTWGIGSTRTVTWRHNLGAAAFVRIELSRNGGASWETVASVMNSAATAGTYTWQVSGPGTTTALVRVSWVDGPANDISDAAFSIVPPAITVTSPNTNVSWPIGTVHNVTWTHNLGTTESVRVESSADGGGSWTTVAASVPNSTNTSGSFAWTVVGPATNAARLRVLWTDDSSVADVSDVNFRVASRITVTAPNTNVAWGAGSTRTMTWNHSYGAGQAFDVAFSPDNGATWTTLATGVAAATATTGTYTGTMPTVITTQALIRVSPAGNAADGDLSNIPFTLALPAIAVASPNTNVNWAIGSIHNVTWRHNLGTLETVRIELSRDGGATWSVVADPVTNSANTSGAFSWTTTGTATAAAQIRVTWSSNGTVFDVSNVNFRIQ